MVRNRRGFLLSFQRIFTLFLFDFKEDKMETGICIFWAIIIGIAGLSAGGIPGCIAGAILGFCLGAKIVSSGK